MELIVLLWFVEVLINFATFACKMGNNGSVFLIEINLMFLFDLGNCSTTNFQFGSCNVIYTYNSYL